MGVGAAPVDRLAVLGAQHVDLAGVGERAAGSGRPWPARRSRRCRREQVVDVLGAAEVVEAPAARRRPPGAAGWGAAPGGSVGSVLVIVAPVGGVPVPVVDVVDVVAVRDRQVPAVARRARGGASSGTAVWRRRREARRPRTARAAAGGAAATPRRARRARSRPARAARSSAPGARRRDESAETQHAADRRDGMPRPIAATSVVRNDRVTCCDGRDRHHHQRADQQQADGAHRDGDA